MTTGTIFHSEEPPRRQTDYDRGRIRLNEHDAAVWYEALALRVDELLDTRGELIDAGVQGAEDYYNRKVRSLRRALGEIERTVAEKGWNRALQIIDAYRD